MPTNRQLPRHNPSQRPTVPRVSNRERWTERFRRLWTFFAIALLFAVISPSVVSLALEKPRTVARVEPATAVDATPTKISGADPLGESRFPGGAALRTDPEQARLLAQAEKSLKDGRIDLAVLVWQKLLDDGLDTLFSEDGRLYAPVSRSVERMLARKGPDVLRVYRIAADAEAAAWMAKATGAQEEEALSTVERRYFLSSQGDDAAFRLACLALDRFDFVTAQRLLNKIRAEHPDPSIPAAELAVRQAVVEARLGDRKAAEKTLAVAITSARPRLDSQVAEWVEKDLQKVGSADSETLSKVVDWPCVLGSVRRRGTMPTLPAAATSKTLSELWQYEFPAPVIPVATAGMPRVNGPVVMGNVAPMIMRGGRVMGVARAQMFVPGGGMPIAPGKPVSESLSKVRRESLLASWAQNKWHPTTQLLLHNGLVYFKSRDQLLCFQTDANTQQPAWKSVWTNTFQPDSMSMQVMQISASMGMAGGMTRPGMPRTEEEIQLFGDRVHQSMSIHGGMVYSIEGQRVNQGDPSSTRPEDANGVMRRQINWGTVPRRTRTNFLAAYDANSGKVKWHRAASDDDKERSTDVGFLAAPTAVGNRLLVPVTDGGNLWLFCLSAEDGKTVWKRYLCDEPSGGCAAWATANIAVDGSEAYLAPGSGIAFAIDTQSGAIRQAIRYARDGKPSMMARYSGNTGVTQLELNGWEDDWVIPYGRQLVIMASDCDKVFAVDRRTGEFLWESPRTSPQGFAADYCLGTVGRGLFVAGRNVVRRYDLPSGRLVWELETEDSLGRGALTADALYLPVKNSVMVLDLERGAERGQVGVALTSNDPVGNLFSDGEKLWMAGAGRVYAMTSLDFRFKQLAEKIQANDVAAMVSRAKLRLKSGQVRDALLDLDAAYQWVAKESGNGEADIQLLTICQELQLASAHPGPFLQLVGKWWMNGELAAAGPAQQRLREDLMAASLARLATGDLQTRDASEAYLQEGSENRPDAIVLKSAPLYGSPQLLRLATGALRRTSSGATKDSRAVHLTLLKNAVESGSATQKLLAAEVFATLAGKDSEQSLAKLVSQTDSRVRLAAARGLASLKDARSLSLFSDLLSSEDPYVRGRSYQTLRGLTGQTMPFANDGAPEQRAKDADLWKKWLADNGKSITWPLPLADGDVPLKRILIVSQSQGTARELDAAHQERWNRKGRPTACQGLSNGHRLIADSQEGMILELDDKATPIWKSPKLNEQVFSLQRLENGNTLASVHSGLMEFTPAGEVTQLAVEGIPASAQRLSNGNTVVALLNQERVVELDAAGNVVWEVRGLSGPNHATRLDSGNTLIVQLFSNQVVEVDRSGLRTVWKSAVPLVQPRAAARLQNGNTLICDQSGLHEVGADGKSIVWEMKQVEITSFHAF